MKATVDVALVGLERAGNALPEPGSDLVSRLPAASAETAFLLRLGIAAVRARAGRKPDRGQAPEAAPAETRPACSDALAALVIDLCRDRSLVILTEALHRLDEGGLRLPPWCLVDLVELQLPSLQPAAAVVAGERGRWLARHNPAWRWLAEGRTGQSPAERERSWEEGSAAARLAALRAMRAEDPARGRSWVESVWKQEKAAVRESLIAALEAGVSADDEPFLSRAAADRAAPVRLAALRLLARLEGSAAATRMRTRAEGLLRYRPASGARRVLGAIAARLAGEGPPGDLEVEPPPVFPAGWAEDGIVEKPPAGTGEKAYWVSQVLALVPPSHWETRFGASPAALVAAAVRSDWSGAVLQGWLEATLLFRSAPWASTLWRVYAANAAADERPRLAAQLLPLLPREEAESLVAPLVASGDPVSFVPALAALGTPWGHALGGTFLDALARRAEARSPGWEQTHFWRAALDRASTALPASCFARALQLSAPAGADAPADVLRSSVESFHAVLAIRQRIHQETAREPTR